MAPRHMAFRLGLYARGRALPDSRTASRFNEHGLLEVVGIDVVGEGELLKFRYKVTSRGQQTEN